MRQMITPDEARRIVLQHVAPLATETVSLENALHRTLAQEIKSDLDLPPFDNSAMDGYALRAADVAHAASTTPVRLQVLCVIAAGQVATETVRPGTCCKIMTGAPMPPGADAVVMREETRSDAPDSVEILAAARGGQNIRPAGDDVPRGAVVLTAGSVINAAAWGMLASLGITQIEVFRRPRVAILATGEELIDPGTAQKFGQIRDSNSWTLEALARECGAEVIVRKRVGDGGNDLLAALHECSETCDAIVTSGGVSVGDFDPVRDVLQQTAQIHFWKIAMKPGKPVMFATRQNRENHEVPIFGLPGNPVSVMVSFELLARPALLQMQGRRALERLVVPAMLQNKMRSPRGKAEFARARVTLSPSGWTATLDDNQSSGRLSSMVRANALLEIPAETDLLECGDTVRAHLLQCEEIE